MLRTSAACAAVCLVVFCAPASAKIYKCTGPEGKISFNDRPCSKGDQEEVNTGKSSSPSVTGQPASSGKAVAPPPNKAIKGADGPQVTGNLFGENFASTKARIFKLNSYVLEIRQGDAFFADREILIFIFGSKDENIAGKTYDIPDLSRRQQPKVIVTYNSSDGQRKQREFESGYTMRLSFGQPLDGTLGGSISLKLRNQSDLSVNGTFMATVDY